jgi:hypothetical protein
VTFVHIEFGANNFFSYMNQTFFDCHCQYFVN